MRPRGEPRTVRGRGLRRNRVIATLPSRPIYFASGTNHPGEIKGFAAVGQAMGVAADECRGPCEASLLALAGSGIPVFVDSGAFNEVKPVFIDPPPETAQNKAPAAKKPKKPKKIFAGFKIVKFIDDDEWVRRLALYKRLAAQLGSQLYAVAPDMVGNQKVTLERLERYAPQVRELIGMGANVMVPLQGGDMPLAEFDTRVEEILGTSDYVRAFPMKKGATAPEKIGEFLAQRPPDRLHLLGLGPKNKDAQKILGMIEETSPQTQVSIDSNQLRSVIGWNYGVYLEKYDPVLDWEKVDDGYRSQGRAGSYRLVRKGKKWDVRFTPTGLTRSESLGIKASLGGGKGAYRTGEMHEWKGATHLTVPGFRLEGVTPRRFTAARDFIGPLRPRFSADVGNVHQRALGLGDLIEVKPDVYMIRDSDEWLSPEERSELVRQATLLFLRNYKGSPLVHDQMGLLYPVKEKDLKRELRAIEDHKAGRGDGPKRAELYGPGGMRDGKWMPTISAAKKAKLSYALHGTKIRAGQRIEPLARFSPNYGDVVRVPDAPAELSTHPLAWIFPTPYTRRGRVDVEEFLSSPATWIDTWGVDVLPKSETWTTWKRGAPERISRQEELRRTHARNRARYGDVPSSLPRDAVKIWTDYMTDKGWIADSQIEVPDGQFWRDRKDIQVGPPTLRALGGTGDTFSERTHPSMYWAAALRPSYLDYLARQTLPGTDVDVEVAWGKRRAVEAAFGEGEGVLEFESYLESLKQPLTQREFDMELAIRYETSPQMRLSAADHAAVERGMTYPEYEEHRLQSWDRIDPWMHHLWEITRAQNLPTPVGPEARRFMEDYYRKVNRAVDIGQQDPIKMADALRQLANGRVAKRAAVERATAAQARSRASGLAPIVGTQASLFNPESRSRPRSIGAAYMSLVNKNRRGALRPSTVNPELKQKLLR